MNSRRLLVLSCLAAGGLTGCGGGTLHGIKIESNPPGAEIYVDEIHVGTAPDVYRLDSPYAEKVWPRSVTIVARMEGRRHDEKTFERGQPLPRRIHFTLYPLPSPGVRHPGDLPAKHIRTGVHRVPVRRREEHYVSHEPQADRQLPKLDRAIEGKSFAFDVTPLEERKDRKVDNGFHIAKAGEIVSRALSREFEELGYVVVVELSELLSGDVEEDALPVDLAKALVASLAGAAEFWVEHGLTDNKMYETRSALRVDLYIRGDRPGATPKEIHRIRVEDEERIVSDKLADSAVRARRSAGAVLGRVVTRILEDSGLEDALVKFVDGGEK